MKEQVVENKKDEIQDYMKRAAALIQSYVPPDPAKIQAAKDAGRVATNPQAGGKVRLVISQYLQPGDSADDRPGPRGQPAARPRRQQLPRQARMTR